MAAEDITTPAFSSSSLVSPDHLILPLHFHSLVSSTNFPMLGSHELVSEPQPQPPPIPPHFSITLINPKLLSHPTYPRLLQPYIDCHKVGAPPEVATLLEELGQEHESRKQNAISTCFGADPELDEFMEAYCDMLVRLKLQFAKQKKKGKLPKEGRKVLVEWWNVHYKWPYPTEADKIALAEATGLHPKQLNNWFINQRKRHWKPWFESWK